MQHPLISHSPDLKRLWDDGYEIEIRAGHLLIHHIPYVNATKEIKYGILVSTLNLSGNITIKPDTHVIYFVGDYPHKKNGQPISSIQHQTTNSELFQGLAVNHSFSNKPPSGYIDYYDKVTRYVDIISHQAMAIDETVTARTFEVRESDDPESVFHYCDSNATRAKISVVNSKLEKLKIAIVGLGGTGSYILDLVAKTPVREIHLFDEDTFAQHNAFRTPGAPTVETLKERKKKVDYLQEIYSAMHKHIIPHDIYINESNIAELVAMDFIFMSLDKGKIKELMIEQFERNNIPFIDVGMGLLNIDDQLIGTVRTTTSTEKKRDHITQKARIPFTEGQENEYSTNIQIADLNALNAALAVIKWKKIYGFYQDLIKENFTAYSVNVGQLLNEDYET